MTTFLAHIQLSPPSSVDGSSLEQSLDCIKALFQDESTAVQQWLGVSLKGKEIPS
jgi:hypothetical protein